MAIELSWEWTYLNFFYLEDKCDDTDDMGDDEYEDIRRFRHIVLMAPRFGEAKVIILKLSTAALVANLDGELWN